MDKPLHIVELFYNQVIAVISYPIDSGSRIFVLYLFTSLMFAYLVYRFQGNKALIGPLPNNHEKGFIKFLFPSYVWREKSAWLDVRYFFVHQLVRYSIYGTFLFTIYQWALQVGSHYEKNFSLPLSGLDEIYIAAIFLIVNALLIDFLGYATHYAQHRFPLLWEFHKVHHSAEVMHPLTNYREHPVDNFLYATILALGLGTLTVVFYSIFGRIPESKTIIGVGIATFVFNMLAYNLRHSHIWLRWPGVLSVLFGSPAHHHVHHSKHPDHINKNFAFMFPFWDKIFGTYCMPNSNVDVDFGLAQPDLELNSVWNLYFVPFKRVSHLLSSSMKKRQKQETNRI